MENASIIFFLATRATRATRERAGGCVGRVFKTLPNRIKLFFSGLHATHVSTTSKLRASGLGKSSNICFGRYIGNFNGCIGNGSSQRFF